MVHKRIRIPKDSAVEIMNELGKLDDAIEFIDLTKDDIEAKKNFGQLIKRCDEIEKKIAYFLSKIDFSKEFAKLIMKELSDTQIIDNSSMI